jgi:hypothetical protein
MRIAFDLVAHDQRSGQKIFVSSDEFCINFCTHFGQNVGGKQETVLCVGPINVGTTVFVLDS